MIAPSKDDLKTYFYVVFSSLNGFIPFRSFAEKGNKNSRPIKNTWISSDDDAVSNANDFANLANKRQAAFYVIPGTVAKVGVAGSSDVTETQVLLIDIDDGDTESKLADLTVAIGTPTMIVESGGITKEGYAKLHIYWQLTKPARGDDLRKLLELRHKIALSFGSDTHFKSAHQPIRVAGSVYHKDGKARPVKIRHYEPIEYELEELIERISCIPTLNDNIASDRVKTANSDTLSPNSLLTTKVYEGSNGDQTRFNHMQRVIGYWLRRYHDGLMTQEHAMEEIIAYNEANVVPPWPLEKIKQMVDGLWQKHIEANGQPKKQQEQQNISPMIKSFSLKSFLGDKSELPEDIIAPRILTPSGIMVFGGAPKVGKSDFLLSLFVHMAAGKEFIGFIPPRPLRIFYFQSEIGYHYLRERFQNMGLSNELINKANDNLHITPNSRLGLNEQTIEALASRIREVFPDKPDIIAVDPIRNVFDGGRAGATENENDAMLFFLQKRIELLRDKVNPDAGIILAHHTKKITRAQFDEDPFQAFSGASSLRGYYTTGVLLYRPEPESIDRHLIFELRNGGEIPPKILSKKSGQWIEENPLNRRIAHKTLGNLFDRERERRIKVIIGILEGEALKGKFYLMKQFAQKFQNHKNLGGRRAIYDDCSAAATKGVIKFFDNPQVYGLPLVTDFRKGFGFMCTADMQMAYTTVSNETGEVLKGFIQIQPTHYKREEDGIKMSITDKDMETNVIERTAEL